MPDTDREAPQARVDLAEFLDKMSDDTIRLMIADWQQGIDQAEAFLVARADPAPDRARYCRTCRREQDRKAA